MNFQLIFLVKSGQIKLITRIFMKIGGFYQIKDKVNVPKVTLVQDYTLLIQKGFETRKTSFLPLIFFHIPPYF